MNVNRCTYYIFTFNIFWPSCRLNPSLFPHRTLRRRSRTTCWWPGCRGRRRRTPKVTHGAKPLAWIRGVGVTWRPRAVNNDDDVVLKKSHLIQRRFPSQRRTRRWTWRACWTTPWWRPPGGAARTPTRSGPTWSTPSERSGSSWWAPGPGASGPRDASQRRDQQR